MAHWVRQTGRRTAAAREISRAADGLRAQEFPGAYTFYGGTGGYVFAVVPRETYTDSVATFTMENPEDPGKPPLGIMINVCAYNYVPGNTYEYTTLMWSPEEEQEPPKGSALMVSVYGEFTANRENYDKIEKYLQELTDHWPFRIYIDGSGNFRPVSGGGGGATQIRRPQWITMEGSGGGSVGPVYDGGNGLYGWAAIVQKQVGYVPYGARWMDIFTTQYGLLTGWASTLYQQKMTPLGPKYAGTNKPAYVLSPHDWGYRTAGYRGYDPFKCQTIGATSYLSISAPISVDDTAALMIPGNVLVSGYKWRVADGYDYRPDELFTTEGWNNG